MSDGDAVQLEGGPVTDIIEAIKVVLKKSIIHDGVARGLRECTKALDRKEAHLAILASDCEEDAYVKLITALCTQHSVNLLKVPSRLELGEWAGLYKLDKDGHPRKVVATSCVVIKNYGEDTPELDFVINYFKSA
eukprot:TRINITY_DN453_c0_g1_i1.p4 TRINITY_DN453_c0_g1~~TRINITY_DN453_c0_g1_i1.p4  ORF type:complete len:135 (-),score=46.23 TRINITY_DN453_c0_g1_i1:222-626(-)